ncbi:MAG: ribonuclease toxin HepT-like protein [Desulfotomaculales bacterium]
MQDYWFYSARQLRAFRRIFRNIYGFNLSPEKIKELLSRLPEVSGVFKREFNSFVDKMRKLIIKG